LWLLVAAAVVAVVAVVACVAVVAGWHNQAKFVVAAVS